MNFLGDMDINTFLQDYWEKKPLLIKNAVKNIESFATPEDFKDLAFDESFESRIIYNDKNNFSLKDGPLTEKDFNQSKWTLACHNLNLLDEQFYELEQKVQFIPTWLFDDVMGTYSNNEATIGAHIDKYNVFILQGNGKRKWELELKPDPTYQEGLPLKILQNFNPDIEWILEPGDMVYIPSSVAHRGTSLSESISYSIGFKSLEDQIILDKFLVDCLENIDTESYLKNTNQELQKDKFEIPESLIAYFHEKVSSYLLDKELFKKWFISFLTQTKEDIEPGETYLEEEIIELSKENQIMKDIYTRFNSFSNNGEWILSINQNLYQVSEESYKMISKWFDQATTKPIEIDLKKLNQESWPLLLDLFKKGAFFFESLD